jgi:hypothetical protein
MSKLYMSIDSAGIDETKVLTGLGRDYPHPRVAHLYEGQFGNEGDPLCRYGWNRDDGESYSIWRGNVGRDGICNFCVKKAQKLYPATKNKDKL